MAITFTPEDGTGIPTANSYLSVVEADDIISTNIHATSWAGLTNDAKEKLLMWATRLLDTKATWYGTKTYETSGLRWPRTGVTDGDGISIPEDEIPSRLKEATAELARSLVSIDTTAPQSRDGLTALKVDVIEFSFDKDYRIPSIPNVIWEAIRDLGYIRSGAGAAKIIKA